MSGSNKTFQLTTPMDLFKKLEWELAQISHREPFEYDISSVYVALNAALTAWHMKDWIAANMTDETYEKLSKATGVTIKTKPQFEAHVLESRAISMCDQIANSAKHVNIHERPHKVRTEKWGVNGRGEKEEMATCLIVADHNSYLTISFVIGSALAYWRKLMIDSGLYAEEDFS